VDALADADAVADADVLADADDAADGASLDRLHAAITTKAKAHALRSITSPLYTI
jgi:hypothetical protein